MNDALKKALRDVGGHFQTAVGEIAWEAAGNEADGWGFEDRVAKLRKQGVRDVPGRLADDLYNDLDTAEGVCGDKIWEAVDGGSCSDAEWNEALMLWLSWNSTYEKVTAKMCKPGQNATKLERLMDEMDQLRSRAIETTERLLETEEMAI